MDEAMDKGLMLAAHVAASTSTCLRRKVGAIAVRDGRVLATGSNKVPNGTAPCSKKGCLRNYFMVPSGTRHELCRGVHAEQNVILEAASKGISLEGADIYVTSSPCVICAKLLIEAGVKRVVAETYYPDNMAKQMLEEAGVVLKIMED